MKTKTKLLPLVTPGEMLNWHTVTRSLRAIAERTGLSKSAVRMALARLRRRALIESTSAHATAVRRHRVLRHWRQSHGQSAKGAR